MTRVSLRYPASACVGTEMEPGDRLSARSVSHALRDRRDVSIRETMEAPRPSSVSDKPRAGCMLTR